ncbi:type VI secretion system tip protein VgrG [Salmonella enterica]|nr:type VI secretion system tip protein VgrG [Salmonella enterica]EDB2190454.1 type VI secretion system tip protein VgrG [Salmonella enterica]EIO2364661.1 type VI secretion system tip protein VgrG [Salmonella enterica]EJH6709310.1 type VI secretion system tip protein VgrG [Salmonella enterica]EJJ2488009.1 type VI secretion system tip protein VgrG [Salmonella enterica]
MSFVSTNNKSGMGGLTTTTPPITGENSGTTAGSVAGSVAGAAEAAVEQALGSLMGDLPEPSGLVKAAVAAAAQAAAAAGAAQDVISALISGATSGPGAHNVTVSGSAVPPQMLLFSSLNGSEALGSLFTYIVQLKTPDTLNLGYVSPAANLPLKAMVGKDLCVNIELDGGGKRHISGLVTAARVVGHEGRSVTYELRMEPWVKLLTHTSDYKAFQNKTVVDILDEVLAEYPYPVEKRLVESYPVRTWQVQYGETDFLQRLMQEWGIYWWFEHSEDSHTLVLADAISTHHACPDSPEVEWHQKGLKLDKAFIHTIIANESLRTGQWVLDDFDFKKPRSRLANTVANPRETGHASYEHYEWPGDYFDKGEGEMLTRIRMEAQRSPGSRVHGAGNIRTLMTGYTFALMNHPTAELNQEYLLAQTTLFVQDNAQHSGQDQHFTFSTRFELHPTREVYRPQRTISKPHTKGPQSAIVTGPSGQEIWTDQYGRVKVQFGWDRYGKMDENSSCWIRVSYPWAGKGFGMIQIPRIGQEVLVDFKNGDPDLPIIVGRTYNQDTMPPWGLPGMASQSGIFSHSLYGGPTNGNMLRFDDKTGAEEVKFHAEKDLNTTVKNNETHTVNADRTKTIIHNEITKVHIDRTEDVFGKHTETIKGNRNVKVTEGDQLLTVEKGIREVTVKTGTSTETVEKDISITSISGAIHLTAKTQITLTVGKSSLTMNSDGTITLNGPTHLALNPQ